MAGGLDPVEAQELWSMAEAKPEEDWPERGSEGEGGGGGRLKGRETKV